MIQNRPERVKDIIVDTAQPRTSRKARHMAYAPMCTKFLQRHVHVISPKTRKPTAPFERFVGRLVIPG